MSTVGYSISVPLKGKLGPPRRGTIMCLELHKPGVAELGLPPKLLL